MKIEVKNLKRGMTVYDEDLEDHYRVFSDPELVDGRWHCEATNSGDFEIIFTEGYVLWDNPERT